MPFKETCFFLLHVKCYFSLPVVHYNRYMFFAWISVGEGIPMIRRLMPI